MGTEEDNVGDGNGDWYAHVFSSFTYWFIILLLLSLIVWNSYEVIYDCMEWLYFIVQITSIMSSVYI